MKSVIVSSNSAGSSRLMSARVCRCRSAEYSKLRRAVVTDGCSKCTLESVNDDEGAPERGPSLEGVQGRFVESLLFWGYIFYRFTPVSRMRGEHPAQSVALGLNPSLTVDSFGARLHGSTEIEPA